MKTERTETGIILPEGVKSNAALEQEAKEWLEEASSAVLSPSEPSEWVEVPPSTRKPSEARRLKLRRKANKRARKSRKRNR